MLLSLAQMAELVDALGSGPSSGNTVEVQILFWAPNTLSSSRSIIGGLFCFFVQYDLYYAVTFRQREHCTVLAVLWESQIVY